jgi:prepilin-type N-terminal cleavage/methylation domain-containing protein/prepilin-type processing-associated H-X9-DG protein
VRRQVSGFTLVELLVVIGVIAVLIAMLMPALAKARRQAQTVQCQSNLRQLGVLLSSYAVRSKGWVFPPNAPGLGAQFVDGTPTPRDTRWMSYVFKSPVWNPPVLLCPTDFEPREDNSYIFNENISARAVRSHTKDLAGISISEMIVMGEKKTHIVDYYSGIGPAHSVDISPPLNLLEWYRHGIRVGSNYLFLDWHVEVLLPQKASRGWDPWSYREALSR